MKLGGFCSFFTDFHKVRRGFVVCFQNLAKKRIKFCRVLGAAELTLQVKDSLSIFSRITIEIMQVFLSSTAASYVSKYWFKGQTV